MECTSVKSILVDEVDGLMLVNLDYTVAMVVGADYVTKLSGLEKANLLSKRRTDISNCLGCLEEAYVKTKDDNVLDSSVSRCEVSDASGLLSPCERCLKLERILPCIAVADSESSNIKAAKLAQEECEDGDSSISMPIIPDVTHVGKRFRAASKNWWLRVIEDGTQFRVNLSALRSLMNNPAFSDQVRTVLKLEDVRCPSGWVGRPARRAQLLLSKLWRTTGSASGTLEKVTKTFVHTECNKTRPQWDRVRVTNLPANFEKGDQDGAHC